LRSAPIVGLSFTVKGRAKQMSTHFFHCEGEKVKFKVKNVEEYPKEVSLMVESGDSVCFFFEREQVQMLVIALGEYLRGGDDENDREV